MKRRINRYEEELRDPALSAVLQETFANDPALADAPGRTERVMRMVLATHVKPTRRPAVWAPFAWTAAASATAMLVVALAIWMVRLPSGWHTQDQRLIAQLRNEAAKGATKHPMVIAHLPQFVAGETPATADNSDTAQAAINLDEPEQPAPAWQPVPPQPKTPAVAEAPHDVAKVAAALYDAGSTAHAAGDLHAAYSAYQASYAAVPTTDALLASSDALGRLADEALNTDDDTATDGSSEQG